jgi:hypothetical protein
LYLRTLPDDDQSRLNSVTRFLTFEIYVLMVEIKKKKSCVEDGSKVESVTAKEHDAQLKYCLALLKVQLFSASVWK